MFSRIRLSLVVTLSLLAAQVTFSQDKRDSLLDVIPYPSNSSDRLDQDEDGWTTLPAGQSVYGIRYDQNGAIIVNNDLVMGCTVDPQFPDDTKVYISPPSPLKKYVLVMCWDRGVKEAYVIDTRNNRVASRDVVPKHWRIIKWVSWSPDERFALVAAAGEVTNGDMAFVDLQANRVEEIHFKSFTNNPRIKQNIMDEIQDFDPDGISWVNAKTFSLQMDVRCNPYDGDESCLTKILRSFPARVNLSPFSISYGNIDQARSSRAKQRTSTRNSQTGRGIRSVDFRNFTYTSVESDGRTTRLVLRKGKNMSPGISTPSEYGSQLEYVKYIDFDGDGNEEAVVSIVTTMEGAGAYWWGHYYVFAYRNGAPVQVFHENPYQADGIRVVGKSLVMSAPFWGEGDPNCCPSATEVTIYQWRGSGFVQVSRRLKPIR